MPSLSLSGAQFRNLNQALRQAFTLARFDQLLRTGLDRNREDIALGDDYEEIVFKVIKTAEAQGWTADLLAAARQAVPGNASLVAVAQDVGIASATPELERLVKAANPFLDVVRFRTGLGEIETRVCRIEVPVDGGTSFGTGFLLGPDVVMTNCHVVQPVIDGRTPASKVVLRFDYKTLANQVVNPGRVYALADDWLIDHSPTSAVDREPEPKSGVPGEEELDYAVMRTRGTPGSDPVGAAADAGGAARGWISAPRQARDYVADTPLLIMQHPDAAPLKLALDMAGIIGTNANGTRLKYKVNTEGGSSGSPCFDAEWELIALHHSGDPNFDPGHTPGYNEGIPFPAILALLAKRSKTQMVIGPW
jgi:Effector-associated domain 1/Trypsin-like peptidase domain